NPPTLDPPSFPTRRSSDLRGQSMIDEHIKDGDFIVVHERNQADNGQTVVALVHGSSATVKRFYREPGGWIRLEPANPAVNPLRRSEEHTSELQSLAYLVCR